MLELIAMLFQSFLGSLLGGYGGYRYAIKDTPGSEHPSGSWQLSTSLISGVCGAFTTVLFRIALVIAFPNADTEKLSAIPLVVGLGFGTMLTKRYLKSHQ